MEQVYLPAGASAADEIKHFAWFRWREAVLLSFVVQSIHDALQDIESREPADATAIERQQADARGVKRVRVAAVLDGRGLRLLHSLSAALVVLSFRGEGISCNKKADDVGFISTHQPAGDRQG